MGIGFRLQHRLVTIASEGLKDVADLPFTSRDPLPVWSLFHNRSGIAHGCLAQFAQMPLKDVLVHRDLLKCDQSSLYRCVAKKDGGTRFKGQSNPAVVARAFMPASAQRLFSCS